MTNLFKKLGLVFSVVFVFHFAHAEVLQFQEGDIIGESEIDHSANTAFFEAATGTRFGHVAVVLKVENNWYVYEETPPKARVLELQKFLDNSPGPFAVIRKQEPLLAGQLRLVKEKAQDIVDREVPYNEFQTAHDGYLNCSEFARAVFAAAGVNVGKIERIQDMNLATFHGYPWQLWQRIHPETKLDDQVTSPASVMRSPGWQVVMGQLDPLKKHSDQELVKAWKDENALEGVAKYWRLTVEQLEKLAEP